MSKLGDNRKALQPETDISKQEIQQTAPLKGLDLLKNMAMNTDDYQRINDQEYYIDQFLPKGGLFMLVSDSGKGKSWLSFMMCKRVLDQHKTTEIIFADIDSGAVYTKSRVQHLWSLYGQSRFNYISQVKVTAEDLMPVFKDMAKQDLRDKIIVIDSLVGMTGGDVNNSEKVKPYLTVFEGLRNAGATVILIHHVKKGVDDEGKPIYAGSYTIKGAMDALYAVTKDDKVIECHLEKSRGDYVSRTFKITDFQKMTADDIDYETVEEKKAKQVKAIEAKQDTELEKIMLLHEDLQDESYQGIKTKDLEELLKEKLGITQKFIRAVIRRNKNHHIIEEVKGEKNTKLLRLSKS